MQERKTRALFSLPASRVLACAYKFRTVPHILTLFWRSEFIQLYPGSPQHTKHGHLTSKSSRNLEIHAGDAELSGVEVVLYHDVDRIADLIGVQDGKRN